MQTARISAESLETCYNPPFPTKRKETIPNSDNLVNRFSPRFALRRCRLLGYREAAKPDYGVTQSGRNRVPV